LRWDSLKSILIIIDVYGWAWDFISRGIIKHSKKFKYEVKRFSEVNNKDRKHDLVFVMNWYYWKYCGDRRKWLRDKKICIGVRGDEGFLPIMKGKIKIDGFHAIGCNSYSRYEALKKKFPRLKTIHYTRNGVDTKIFKQVTLGNRFNVGWAGTAKRQCKRVEIAKQLNFPVKIISQKGGKFFKKGISRQKMVNFYKSIDCLILTSNIEGMNNTVLEAAASGLPVVSTAVGDVPRLIPEKWLTPIEPPKRVVKEMNEKLSRLNNSVELRRKVGHRNRKEIERNWSWNIVVKDYERMFESALK